MALFLVFLLRCAIFFFFFNLSSSSPLSATPRNASRFTKIFAFGDSYTDTGNTRTGSGPTGFLHASSFPYGTTFFHHPTNRYSDGRLVIDFVAEALSLPYLPAFLHLKAGDTSHGVNFAVAGSTAINHEFFVRNNLTLNVTPQSLQTQLSWFKKYLETQGCIHIASPRCRAITDDALFWIGEIGVNDYAYTIGSSVSRATVQPLAISSTASFLQELLRMGAKYIVVQNLPPTGCLPLTLILAPPEDKDDIGCVRSINNMMFNHNSLLHAKLRGLRKQYPHAIISYADFFSAYRLVMKNTQKFKFKEPFKTCCGTGGGAYNYNPLASCGTPQALIACPKPSQFINWDGVHLTEAMYKVVSSLFLHGKYAHPPFGFLLTHKRHES